MENNGPSVAANAFGGNTVFRAPPNFFAKSIHVRVGVEDLTVSQMRLVLGRLARTHPDVVATAMAEVIGLIHRNETRERNEMLLRTAEARKRRRTGGTDRPASNGVGGEGSEHGKGHEIDGSGIENPLAETADKVSAGEIGVTEECGEGVIAMTGDDVDISEKLDIAPRDTMSIPDVPDINHDDITNDHAGHSTEDINEGTGQPRWDANFNLLRQYVLKNGTTCVSRVTHPRLAKWVYKQRNQYRKWKLEVTPAGPGGRPPTTGRMTDKKAELLESLGIAQDMGGIGHKWNRNFENLKLFKAEFGNTRVPRSHGKLGIWVMSQRAQYWKYVRGQRSQMTKERISALSDIGFDWGTPNRK